MLLHQTGEDGRGVGVVDQVALLVRIVVEVEELAGHELVLVDDELVSSVAEHRESVVL